MIIKPKEILNNSYLTYKTRLEMYALVAIIPDNSMKQLVLMNVSLWLTFKNNMIKVDPK